MFNFVKELLAVLLITAFFVYGIMYSAQKEDELVRTHCSGLSGYEYGQCQASIY